MLCEFNCNDHYKKNDKKIKKLAKMSNCTIMYRLIKALWSVVIE